MRLYFAQNGLDLVRIDFKKAEDLESINAIGVKED